jgi:hypothetical protein
MCDIRSRLSNIPAHLSQSTLMIITIQQLILSLATVIPRLAGLVNLQTCLFKNHIQPLPIRLFLRCLGDRRGDGD